MIIGVFCKEKQKQLIGEKKVTIDSNISSKNEYIPSKIGNNKQTNDNGNSKTVTNGIKIKLKNGVKKLTTKKLLIKIGKLIKKLINEIIKALFF